MIAQVAVRRKGTAHGLEKMECFQELTLGTAGKQAQWVEEPATSGPVHGAAGPHMRCHGLEGRAIPLSHLSLPANSPNARTKVGLSETAHPQLASRAKYSHLTSEQAGGRVPCPALPAAWRCSPTSGSESPCLDTDVFSAGCTLACCPDLGLAFCPPDAGILPEPSCQCSSEVTRLLHLPGSSLGSGLSHCAADKMIACGSLHPHSCASLSPGD